MSERTASAVSEEDQADMARAILGRWATRRDIVSDTGASMSTVIKWHNRGRIPPEYDCALVEGAKRRGFVVSHQEIAESRRLSPRLNVQDGNGAD